MSDRATPSARSDYPIFYSLESRWADNDIYGHINNVAYYAYFDSVVNRFLIEEVACARASTPSWAMLCTRALTISPLPVIPRR